MQSAIPSPAVRVSNVSLNYYTPERETLALSNVSLDIEEGDFVAIVGSSGCGKSTLLSLVSPVPPLPLLCPCDSASPSTSERVGRS